VDSIADYVLLKTAVNQRHALKSLMFLTSQDQRVIDNHRSLSE